MTHNANSTFIFDKSGVIFTTLVHGVLMTSKVPDHQYDIEVKGQCQIYSKPVKRIVT